MYFVLVRYPEEKTLDIKQINEHIFGTFAGTSVSSRPNISFTFGVIC